MIIIQTAVLEKNTTQFVKSIQHVAMKKLEENMIWQLLGLFDLGLGLHLLTNLVAQFLHYTKKRQINLFSFLLTQFIDFIWISFWIKIFGFVDRPWWVWPTFIGLKSWSSSTLSKMSGLASPLSSALLLTILLSLLLCRPPCSWSKSMSLLSRNFNFVATSDRHHLRPFQLLRIYQSNSRSKGEVMTCGIVLPLATILVWFSPSFVSK